VRNEKRRYEFVAESAGLSGRLGSGQKVNEAAAAKLHYLFEAAFRRVFNRVKLKDESGDGAISTRAAGSRFRL